MKLNKSIHVLFYSTILASLCGTLGCRYKVQKFSDKYVKGGELRSPLQNIFAHLNQKFYLTVNRTTFANIRGTPPFYLEIPQLHSLLFVTGKMDAPATFHIYSLDNKHDTSIEGGPAAFGWEVGGNIPTNLYTVYVLSANTGQIKLAWNRDDSKQVIVLHLDSKSVQVENPTPNQR